MIAGLPGTGIGGMFYLLSAFLMPLYEINKRLRSKSRRRGNIKLIAEQWAISLGMLAAFWVTGLVLGALLGNPQAASLGVKNLSAHNVFRFQPLFISFGILFFVLAFVHFQSIIVARRLNRLSR